MIELSRNLHDGKLTAFLERGHALISHDLEHKVHRLDDKKTFDVFLTDGVGNHVLGLLENGTVKAVRVALDPGGELRQLATQWIIDSYYTDEMTRLPPVAVSRHFLGLADAQAKGIHALRAGLEFALLPLGWDTGRVESYYGFKLSSQVFRTPKQYRTYQRQMDRFRKETALGYEILALGSAYGDRLTGSLGFLFSTIYKLIREGKTDLAGNLKTSRLSGTLQGLVNARKRQIQQMKTAERETFAIRITQASNRAEDPTGIQIGWLS